MRLKTKCPKKTIHNLSISSSENFSLNPVLWKGAFLGVLLALIVLRKRKLMVFF